MTIGVSMPKSHRCEYTVCCAVCYSCVLLVTTKRKDADREATSHMNAYQHEVYVNTKPQGDPSCTSRLPLK